MLCHIHIKQARMLAAATILALSWLRLNEPAQAQVIAQEDWETTVVDSGNQFSGWDGPSGGGANIVTSEKVSGQRSLQLNYYAGGNGAPYLYKWFDAGYDTIYYRWYQKWSSNWVWQPVSTKMTNTNVSPASAPGCAFEVLWGNGQFVIQCGPVAEANWDSYNYYQNTGSTSTFLPGQWYCIEVKVKMNSPGLADGEISAWVNDELKISYPNRRLRGASTSDPAPSTAKNRAILITGSYENVPQNQTSWNDANVVSTQRIGCLGSNIPKGDTTAPSAPTGLRAN